MGGSDLRTVLAACRLTDASSKLCFTRASAICVSDTGSRPSGRHPELP